MLKLQGIFSSIATPFDANGDIYRIKIRHNVEKWNLIKLAGYVVCGSPGEGVHLSTEDKILVWNLVAEAAGSDRLLIADTAAEGVRETVTLSNQAAGIGYKAVLARAPRFYGDLVTNPAAQELYFNAIADGSNLPVIVDNCSISVPPISQDSIAKLSQHPNIVAIVDGSGKLTGETKGFQVLAGNAEALAQSLEAGAAGAVLGFANAAPYTCITIWEAHRTREHEAAMDWQKRISHPAALVTTRYGIPGLKYAMDLNGYYGGPCRLPLRPLTPEAKREIEDAFADLKG